MRRDQRLSVVRYDGALYSRDLRKCQIALTQRQVDGDLSGGKDALARAAGTSRSTVSRFFNGQNLSVDRTVLILGVLKLRFEDVHTPLGTDDEGPLHVD